MKRQTFIASAITTTLLLRPAVSARAATPVIHVSAKNWSFAPSTITLHLNQPVKLVFVSTEGMHGIAIPDLGVNDVLNIGSTPSEILVTPKKLGTFVAHCAVFCGAGHANMVLTIKVVE